MNSGFVDCYGIYSYMDMNIGENAVVTVEMGAAPKNCYGIYSYDDLTISDNAVVTRQDMHRSVVAGCMRSAICRLTELLL